VIEDMEHKGLPEPHRLEGLSDGTFSIIITLLVLEIHRPSATPRHLGEELLTEWPSYLAYARFLCPGVIWLNHHYLFERLCESRSDAQLDQFRNRRHTSSDSVSDRRRSGRLSRRQPLDKKVAVVRLDRRTNVGVVAASFPIRVSSSRIARASLTTLRTLGRGRSDF